MVFTIWKNKASTYWKTVNEIVVLFGTNQPISFLSILKQLESLIHLLMSRKSILFFLQGVFCCENRREF
jgi:hypothetical protein